MGIGIVGIHTRQHELEPIKAVLFGEFAIHRTTFENAPPAGWTVTHVLSGYAMIRELPTTKLALAALREFANCGVDFTKYKGVTKDLDYRDSAILTPIYRKYRTIVLDYEEYDETR